MPTHDDLGLRMKSYYETIPKTRLMRRTPVAIRIDGKAFHTFTRGFQKPFDPVLMDAMQRTMRHLCENIQGCVLGYTQSDEITLILVDYKKLTSDAWFDYEVQKMCSVAASMATMAFNKFFAENVHRYCSWTNASGVQANRYAVAVEQGAMFDARCFNIPKEEVTNLIYWRQLDAIRNSIQMVGQAHFSHKQLQHKSCSDIQNMLMLQKGINWNDLPVDQKRGSCCVKANDVKIETTKMEPMPFGEPKVVTTIETVKSHWVIDQNTPIFKGEGRKYIEELIQPEEE